MKKFILTIGSALVSVLSLYALEVDEKLTTRFLKVSNSKKTALLNRGLEDGLVVGDHAKFFLTTGVIARGMVIKASPTRSVWSLYRIIDGNSIFSDKVVNIKISHPLKVTEDASKSFKIPEGGVPTGVEVVSSGEEAEQNAAEDLLLDAQGTETTPGAVAPSEGFLVDNVEQSGVDENRTWEVFGLLHWGQLSSQIDSDTSPSLITNSADLGQSVGFEKYFSFAPHSVLRNVSIKAILNYNSTEAQALGGEVVSQSVLEYGGGISWHFMADPLSYQSLIGLVGLDLGVGRTTNANGNSQVQSLQELVGSSQFASFGAGLKYYLPEGVGMRVFLSYYRRKESYLLEAEGEGFNYSKTLTGPRLQLGISYRW